MIKDKCYTIKENGNEWVVIAIDNINGKGVSTQGRCYNHRFIFTLKEKITGTPERKQWIEECIKQSDYIDEYTYNQSNNKPLIPNKNSTPEERLEYAKKHYHEGIKYQAAHINNTAVCTVGNKPLFFDDSNNNIKESYGNNSKNGHSMGMIPVGHSAWEQIDTSKMRYYSQTEISESDLINMKDELFNFRKSIQKDKIIIPNEPIEIFIKKKK